MVIGIVGLGLMGGSLGKAIKKYKIAQKTYGYDHNISHQEQALELNLVDEIVDLEKLKSADIIVLAIPVDGIISFMNQYGELKTNTTIIDFGSTKELIVKNIPKHLKSNFIPAHPMTGTEKFGPGAAIDNLYEEKTVVLCDLEKIDEFHKTRAINIFAGIKMNIIYMNSKEHDIHACYMSHLPHAISFSLANTVMSHEDPKSIIALAAGGFKDMSRVAKSSPNMWSDIFRQNRQNLLDSITLFQGQMQNVKNLVEDENYDELKLWMSKANTLHDIL